MEAKFLASVFSFLSIFLAIYAQELVNVGEDSTEFEFDTAIYYGDSSVNLGEPFSITCIIPITDPILWVKDDEPITRHNLRHGRDEHSFILTESAIEGEKHKIEAHISVRHALKVHEGKYQCNTLHTSYHMLQVRSPVDTKSPFTPPLNANDNQLSTESVYETIHELTPSTADEIYTRTWEPVAPGSLPTGTTHYHQQQQQQQHRKHHHHHHQQLEQQQEQQQHQLRKFQEEDPQHKLIYSNSTTTTTTFDGIARSASESDENGGIINVGYLPPTQYNELTTVPWKPTTVQGGGGKGGRVKQPPPVYPPPRTTMLSSSVPPQTTVTHYPYPYPYPGEYYHSATSNSAATSHGQQLQQQHEQQKQHQEHHQHQQRQQLAKFPLQTMQPNFQQPSLTTYHQQMWQPTGQPMQTMHPPHHQQHPVHLGHMPFAPITTSTVLPQVIVPIRKEPDFLVPNYDNATHQLKVYEIRSPLVLSCNITKEGDYVLTWEKNGTDVTKVKELEGRYRIIPAERKFIIDRTDTYDDGLYSCSANNHKKNFNVVARVVVRVPSNTGVVEGEKLTIVCTVVGTDPQLYWSIGNLTIFNSTDRYILKPDENKIENAVLTVENISLDDRGEFKCYGRNAANEYTKTSEASDASYVRVKGKLAALWPFLGICAEVLILCTIILIYEKRRNKSELEESDTDPQEQKKKRRSYD